MKDMITASALELLTFFEVEPTSREPGEPWPYNDWLYETVRRDVAVSFAVSPAVRDVRLILRRAEATIYELNALQVDDVLYHRDRPGDALELVLSARDRLWLRLKPQVTILHALSGRI